jgi:hypothetical protein
MLDVEKGHDLEAVLRHLTEAIDWCLPRARESDPIGCLRAPEVGPEPLAGCRKDVVASVVRARQVAMRWPKSRSATGLAGGRLLGYAPDETLSDGAAELESQGFFDVHNVPPWDTWIAYVYESDGPNYLVSWVPPVLVDLVTGGISVNPEDCIWWLDEEEACLSGLLRERGILSPSHRSGKPGTWAGWRNPMWDSELDQS